MRNWLYSFLLVALSLPIWASALTSNLSSLVSRACALQESGLNFRNDEDNQSLARHWKALHVELESLVHKGGLTPEEISLHQELNACSTRALETVFRDIKATSLSFGQRPLNDVVFWISRFINASGNLLEKAEPVTKTSVKEIVRTYLQNAYDYSARGVSYEKVLRKIKRKVKAIGLDPSTIEQEVSDIQKELEDHFVLNGVQVKEGDILLLFDDHALGDLAYPMVGIENLMGHGAMVVSGRWGPIKTYYVAEVLDKITTSKLKDFPQSVVLRPKGFSLAGKTAQIMQKIQSKPFRFDAKFRDDLFDEEGTSYSLYCAEFIHYAYKNGFDPNAPSQPSPFDFVDFRVEQHQSALNKNAQTLGLPMDSRLFLPEQLFFNSQTELVGVLRTSRFKRGHPTRQRMLSELESEFYHELKKRFVHRYLRPLKWTEKKTIDALLWAANFVSIYDMRNVEFPAEGGQYYFFKLILLVASVKNLVWQIPRPMTECEQELVWTRFHSEIIPKIDDLFIDAESH